jgi:hypothetical protein
MLYLGANGSHPSCFFIVSSLCKPPGSYSVNEITNRTCFNGTWHPEDPSGAVRLDLFLAKFHSGLYAENCFVLATVCLCVDNLWNLVPGGPEWCCEARSIPGQVPHWTLRGELFCPGYCMLVCR